jgi:hypothetical protein
MSKTFTLPGPVREAPVEPEDQGGSYAPCAHCEGTGLVVDNRREELADCPSCDGMGVLWFADAGEDEPEHDDDDEEG